MGELVWIWGRSPLCQIRHLDLFDSVGGSGGSAYLPNEMDVYYGTVQSAVVHTNETPLSKNPHLEPRFPDGGSVGWCAINLVTIHAINVDPPV